MRSSRDTRPAPGWLGLLVAVLLQAQDPASLVAEDPGASDLIEQLDAPVLFVKRFNYLGLHIYDTYYKWRPGGGIYVIENPAAAPAERRTRPLIDPTTTPTLGEGVYSDPELSWDARRLLFCFKPEASGSTSVYEIAVDGTGLRRLSDPRPHCVDYKGTHGGQHDVSPAYLPDGRIVFTSTRLNGLVPCANSGVDILHVMDTDGSDLRAISVNNVNEFDPCVLADGRLLFGRWEYVDKTALTQQSLWTVCPDGTNETAFYANNMVHPEAILDARPVPGAPNLVVGTFTPHNAPPRGTIAMLDVTRGKNSPEAIFNFERPDAPTFDRGESCEPWPLAKDVVLYSGRPQGHQFNAILMTDRSGRRVVVHSEPDIDCHSPMLIEPRQCPPTLHDSSQPGERTGRFLVQDVHLGLDGVERGEVKWLRVIEETSRTTGTHGAAYNQTFLLSAVLAFSVKNFLGIVPVEPDGSAYFEVPSGRAVYLQALDAEGRLIRSMRTFIQAVPGTTRSCIGCHERKNSAPPRSRPLAMTRPPQRLQDESWGSGFIDYPSDVQPVLDRHCVRCHGGEEGFAARLDLSGGWTEHFNISYENLTSRRHTQLTAHLIAGIDCMNGTAHWSAKILPPRAHGSGAAPLAEVLVSGHHGHIPDLTRAERDLILAWIDTNGLYYGTWDYAESGAAIGSWAKARDALTGEMRSAGCLRCHGDGQQLPYFENDWINLRRPERSRILRAPMKRREAGPGLGMCRDQKVDPRRQRLRILWKGYSHAALPLDAFPSHPDAPPLTDERAVTSFESAADPHYRNMLAIIQECREAALAAPRTDMPGAKLIAGNARRLVPVPIPDRLPALAAKVDPDGIVHLAWERSARTIGLSAELHRHQRADFAPDGGTLIAATSLFRFADVEAPPGTWHYALMLVSEEERSTPIRTTVDVPAAKAPSPPTDVKAVAAPGSVELIWSGREGTRSRYHVDRAPAGTGAFERLTSEPIARARLCDTGLEGEKRYVYRVTAVSRRGLESQPSVEVVVAALPEIRDPVFVAKLREDADARLIDGARVKGKLHGKARIADRALDLRDGGHVTFDYRGNFDLTQKLTVECRVQLVEESQMPVVVSCGHWRQAGWFLQRIGAGWRWHVGGIDCDGGRPAPGEWTHLVCTFDGRTARLYQDGGLVAEVSGSAIQTPWTRPLHVGQYSGGPGAPYQVHGRIQGLRIYRRALTAEEIGGGVGASERPLR